MLSALDQDPAQMAVAALGDASQGTFRAAAVFAGNQSEITHELPWMIKACKVAEFTDGNHRRDGLEAFEAFEGHEGFDDGFEMPGFKLAFHVRLDARHAFSTIAMEIESL